MQSKDKTTTTLEQVIEAIDAKVVASTQYEEASKCLDSMLVFAGTKSKGMMLFGNTGLGKTTVLRKFAQRHKDKLADKVRANLTYPVDVVPIVRINMNARPTVKVVCRAILKKAGHPDLTGTAEELEDRVDNLILEQKLQILIIDECQHLLKKNAGAHASSVLNCLKNRMCEENKLVVIFAGMPAAENALNDHPEIRRRLNYRRCYMRPFTNETNAEFKNFASLLAAFDELMHETMGWSFKMCSNEVTSRILFATGGNPSYFKDLLTKVTMNVWEKKPTVSLECFSNAYMENPLNPALGKLNPFKADIETLEKALKTYNKSNKTGRKR
ncbi:hypothetical protein JCM19238_3810 [Vibrio ponticus]|nr:hypothetical protein JCM19238_3810 [Vibrio ponticus]